MAQKTISIIVSGKVQGVFYRQSAKEKATALGITGSVKNEKGGNVYIVATGTKEQLDALVMWCRQGPPKAKVTDVITMDIVLQYFDEFSILRY